MCIETNRNRTVRLAVETLEVTAYTSRVQINEQYATYLDADNPALLTFGMLT